MRHSYLLCHTTHKGKTAAPPPHQLYGGGVWAFRSVEPGESHPAACKTCDILRLVTVKFQQEPSGVRCSKAPSAPGSDCCRDTFCLSDLKWCFPVFFSFLNLINVQDANASFLRTVTRGPLLTPPCINVEEHDGRSPLRACWSTILVLCWTKSACVFKAEAPPE